MEKLRFTGGAFRCIIPFAVFLFTSGQLLAQHFKINKQQNGTTDIWSFWVTPKAGSPVQVDQYHYIWKFEDCYFEFGDTVLHSFRNTGMRDVAVVTTRKGEEYDDADDPADTQVQNDTPYNGKGKLKAGFSRAPRPGFQSFLGVKLPGRSPSLVVITLDNALRFYNEGNCGGNYPLALNEEDANDDKQQTIEDLITTSCSGVQYIGKIKKNQRLYLFTPSGHNGMDSLFKICTPQGTGSNLVTTTIVDAYSLITEDERTANATSTTVDPSKLLAKVKDHLATGEMERFFIDSEVVEVKTVNSWDPNKKEVHHPFAIAPGQWLTYTIHFQNTGNAYEPSVTLEDQLPDLLDGSTLEIIDSSHHYQMTHDATEPQKYRWDFNSTIDPTFHLSHYGDQDKNSQGFITFRIRVKHSVQPGDTIRNRAKISFNTANQSIRTEYTVNAVPVQGTPTRGKCCAPAGCCKRKECGGKACCWFDTGIWHIFFAVLLLLILIMLVRINARLKP